MGIHRARKRNGVDSARPAAGNWTSGANLAADSTAKVLGHVMAVSSRFIPSERRCDKLNRICDAVRARGGTEPEEYRTAATIAALERISAQGGARGMECLSGRIETSVRRQQPQASVE